MFEKEWTPAELIELSHSFANACVLHAAINLDIFSALDIGNNGEGMSLDELSSWIDCEDQAVSILATALVAMKLLERKGDELVCTPFAKRYLSSNSKDFMGNIVRHMSYTLKGWIHLDKSVCTGEPAIANAASEDTIARSRDAFLRGMQDKSMQMVEQVMSVFDTSSYKSMLDLGGGSGTYSVFFCKNNPDLHSTIVDKPHAAQLSVKLAARYGVADRVRFQGGNFYSAELPHEQDLVWISDVLHGESPEACTLLLEKAVKSLKKGGTIAVLDAFLENDLSGPLESALLGLNMLVCTKKGQAYTLQEIQSMLKNAGLTNIQRLDAELPGKRTIFTAKKP